MKQRISYITFFLIGLLLIILNLFISPACKREMAVGQKRQEQPMQTEKMISGTNETRINLAGPQKRQGWRWQDHSLSLNEKEKEMVKIETIRVSTQKIRPYLTAVGRVLAPITKMCVISYAFPARIVTFHGRVGDWVREKSPLVTLQSEEVGRAKADFFKAIADYELARRNYERQKKLFERGAGAQKDLLQAEAEFKVAEANLNAMEKRLHVLGFSEEELQLIKETHQINPVITLYAPINGKIVDIKVVPGEMVDQTKEIMTILDPTILWVDAEIFEKDIAKVKTGQEVEISVQAYPEKNFSGKVCYVGDVLKEETRTVTVRTEVFNQGLLLKPGMFASIKIYLDEERSVVAVPEESVLDDQGEKFVFVRQGDNFQARRVFLGAKQNGFYEVLEGIRVGEEVVTTGSYELKGKLFQEVLKSAGLH